LAWGVSWERKKSEPVSREKKKNRGENEGKEGKMPLFRHRGAANVGKCEATETEKDSQIMKGKAGDADTFIGGGESSVLKASLEKKRGGDESGGGPTRGHGGVTSDKTKSGASLKKEDTERKKKGVQHQRPTGGEKKKDPRRPSELVAPWKADETLQNGLSRRGSG